jgi:hypothetical protein
MLIRNYGLFWRASEVNWNPGKGIKGGFRLLGRQGSNSPSVQIADFRNQQGIYVLYGNYGAYYVGLTRKQGLGKRLKDHLTDKHADMWDRFSWFGFCATMKADKHTGICPLKQLAELSVGSPSDAIADMEALLIKAVGPINTADMKFKKATEWLHVERDETDYYLNKVAQS